MMLRVMQWLFGCGYHGYIHRRAATIYPVRCERRWRHAGPHQAALLGHVYTVEDVP